LLSITKINSSSTQVQRNRSTPGGYLFYLGSPSTRQRTDFVDYVQGKEPDQAPAAFWAGNGPGELSLGEAVLQPDVEKLSLGFSPTDGTALVRGAGARHVMGVDMTFSAPKDVSALFAGADAGTQSAINDCMREAVLAAIAYSESISITRHGKAGRIKQIAQAIIAACYPHFSNRSIQPQLHVHAFLFNLGKRTITGEWSALDHKAQFDHKMTTGMLFRVELAHRLAQLGFEIEPDGQYFKIKGVNDEQRKALSKRSQEIEAYMTANNLSGPAGAQVAALNTRSAKAEPAYPDLLRHFKAMAQELGLTPESVAALRQSTRSLEPFSLDHADILAELTEQHSAVSVQDALHLICKKSIGRWNAAECREHLERFLEYPDVLRLGSTEHLTQVITSRLTYDRERGIDARVQAGLNDARFKIAKPAVRQAFEKLGNELSEKLGTVVNLDQQRLAAEHACGENGQHAFIVGSAGTGKTTLLKALAEIHETAGYSIVGCAQSASAARNLSRETGIRSSTIASLLLSLDRGNLTLNEKTILIVDEAGVVGSREFELLQRAMLSPGRGGKMICVGDHKQAAPIEAGGIFRALMEKYGQAEITTIQRQRTNFQPLYDELSARRAKPLIASDKLDALKALPEAERVKVIDGWAASDVRLRAVIAPWKERCDFLWLRTAVEAFSKGSSLEALQLMEAKGRLKMAPDASLATSALIDSWRSDPTPLASKIIIAGLRDEVHEFNQLARQHLIATGFIDASRSLSVSITHRDESRAQRDFAPGDRIVFTKNDNALGVLNGSTGSLVAIPDQDILRIELDEPNERQQNQVDIPVSFSYFDHAYSLTTFKSQGRTFDSVHVYLNPLMAGREWTYVAASRSRYATTLYVPTDALDGPEQEDLPHQEPETKTRKLAIERLAERMSRTRTKMTTLDYVSDDLQFAPAKAPSSVVQSIVEKSREVQNIWQTAAERFLQKLHREKSKELEQTR
jgi:conjugative relaxase-like TrwC/TraI family protein